jgi:predicted  nucleic acid-binding Zn-ribbon protein
MRNPRNHPRRLLRTSFALVALSGLALGACERDGASKKALEEASIRLESLDTGLGSAPSVDHREQVYNAVVTSLKEAADSDVPAYASSANILLAKAHTGLSETPATQAALLEADSLNRVRVLRADLAQWLEMNAVAVAADSYDAEPEIAALESQVKEIQGAVAGLTKARADVANRRDALVTEASGLSAESKTLRDEIGSLRMRISTVNATEGAAITEQIRERSRAADGLELKASEINARAELLVPQIAEIELNITGLNNQIESLRAAQAAAEQRSRDAKSEATEARALAATAAERIDKGATALIELRDGDIARAYESAQRTLTSGAGAARKASNDNRTASKLAEGVALQQSADLTWQLAQGLAEHHAILNALATATPDLPRSGAYEGAATAAATARGEALTKAAETYEQAKGALTSAGAKGEAAERLERVGRMLDLIIQATQGETVDWSAANRPAPSEAEDAVASEDTGDAPAGDSGDLGATIQGWVRQLEAGDTSFIADAVHTDVPAISNAVGSLGQILTSMQRLDAACKDAFGQTLSEFGQAQAADGAVPGMGQIPSFDDFSLDDLTIAVDGDNATVTPNDAPDGEPIHFIRIDGAWKVNASRALMPAEFADLEPMIEPIVALLPQIDAAIGEVIDTVGSGGYVSLQAVTIDLQQKIMPIVMEAMGSMQPPPGGG